MTNELITQSVWRRLTTAAKKTRRPSSVAVAYFGKDAAALLPLKQGSRLVVDASESAVTSGQTCPAELIKLADRGVRVYSVPNLHAKLFLLGNRVYIGSANASHHSAETMLEAVMETTDRETVKAARAFVRDLCLRELGPEELSRLAKLYKPPIVKGRRPKRRKQTEHIRPRLPRLRIAQLKPATPPAGSESTQKQGMKVAKSKQEKPHTHVIEDIFWAGNCAIRIGDTVIQVVDEGEGRKFVCPPANVIHTRVWRRGKRRVTFVYLEVPSKRRKRVDRLARLLGYGAKKLLHRTGEIKNQKLAEKLLGAWAR